MNRNFNGKHLLFEIKKISKKKLLRTVRSGNGTILWSWNSENEILLYLMLLMKFTRSLLLFCNFRWVVKIVWKLSFTPAGFQVENLKIRVSGRVPGCAPGSGTRRKPEYKLCFYVLNWKKLWYWAIYSGSGSVFGLNFKSERFWVEN